VKGPCLKNSRLKCCGCENKTHTRQVKPLQEVVVREHERPHCAPSQCIHLTINSKKPQNAFGCIRCKRRLNKFITTLTTSMSLQSHTECLWPLPWAPTAKLRSTQLVAWKACMMHDYLKHMDKRPSFNAGKLAFLGTWRENFKTIPYSQWLVAGYIRCRSFLQSKARWIEERDVSSCSGLSPFLLVGALYCRTNRVTTACTLG